MIDTKEMREIYCESLINLAKNDPRIVVLEADLMKATGTVPFKEAFPQRMFDVGVAEQNMVAMAAGLAATGKIPFAHTFCPFMARRACDQVTISVAYAKRNVKLGGTDPGVSAELNGGTHMSFEDVAIMRAVAGMMIVEPVDGTQLRALIPLIAAHEGPVYMRLFRRKAFTVFGANDTFTLGKACTLKEGRDVTIIASGLLVEQALAACDTLAGQGVTARVLNMHTIKPIDAAAVLAAARDTGAIVTTENHSVVGGLGSAVSEVVCENLPVPVVKVGVRDHFGEVGKMDHLMKKFGLLAPDIVAAAQKAISLKSKGAK